MTPEPKPVINRQETGGKPAADLVAEARVAGLKLTIEDGKLVVRGPRGQADLGRAVVARKAEVLEYLTRQQSSWDAVAAVRRMEAADAAVELHGCSGADPAVQAAAGRACEAYQRRDADGLARACDEVVALAKANPSGTART